jgi:hypothetical protein
MQMKQKSSSGVVRPKKLKNLVFYRNVEMFLSLVKTLKEQKANFKVAHSKYTTSILLPDGSKVNFILRRYRDKVFISNKMILKDLKAHPKFQELKNSDYSTKNFAIQNGIDNCSYPEVINLDISSAYATTMKAQGLISEGTFKMLQSLEKHERLPSMGMLAKRSLIFDYKDGECVDTQLELGENRQVFFFLIQKVEECIRKCRELSGDYYLFHWVDGIFIRNDIPVPMLQSIEGMLSSYGYKYKYEKVLNFELTRNKEILSIKMNKNGEDKVYTFNDPNFEDNFETLVRCLENLEVSQTENRLHEGISVTSDVERLGSDGTIDYSQWLDAPQVGSPS